MLTALAHLILACSRSRSLIADSMRDHPDDWRLDKDSWLHFKDQKVVVYIGCSVTCWSNWPKSDSEQKLRWAEARLVRQAARSLIARGKAKAARQFRKALKAALTGEE